MPAKSPKSLIEDKKIVKAKSRTTKVPMVASVQKLDEKKSKSTKDGLKMDVYDAKGKVVEQIQLSKEIFGAPVNKSLLAQAVRVYLANQRRGTVSTKTRGEVQGSTRKIYKQKGTGRARHGSIRAPIFVKGGIVFGPKPRDFSLALPKKMKRKALFSALSAKVQGGEVKVVTGLEKIEPKTKAMVAVLKNLDTNSKKRKVLLILDSNQENIVKSARNIADVQLAPAHQLNSYDVLNNTLVILTKSAVGVIEQTFGGK